MDFRRVIMILMPVLFASALKAQSISAQVSDRRVQVGVPFEFAVIISGNSSNYNQPYFRDFDLVFGPHETRNIQDINGVVSQQLIFSYHLVAKKEGKFVIPSANALVAGQRLETAPIVIEAVRGPNSPGGNPQNNPHPRGEEVYLQTGVSKKKCYVGEQIYITHKIYSRHQIIGYAGNLSLPTYDGIYSYPEELQGVRPENEILGGVNYQTYLMWKSVAIPNKPGKPALTPYKADLVVRKPNTKPRNLYEQFLGVNAYEDVKVTAKSTPFVIEVMPLPEDGKPENFGGAVGSFNAKVTVDRNELPANEAINLKFIISGRGNLKLISPPKLELPESFETYEPKVSETAGSRVFDYLLIPRQQGEFTLKNLDFSYFDLDTKKYVTIPSPEISIKVLQGDRNSAGAQVYTPQHQVKETENDIRYIKKGNFQLQKGQSEFFNSGLHLGLLGLIFFGLIGSLAARSAYVKQNSNQVLVRERQAAKAARKQLVNAEKLMKENRKDEFYAEILMALNRYISHKLNIPIADLSRSRVQDIMKQRQVDEATLQKLLTTLDNSEYARYAPGAVSGDLRLVYDDTVQLITGLDQQLNRKPA